MSNHLITAPAVEPLTVAELRTQLQFGSTAGEPAPTAPTISLASPAAAGNCDNGVHSVGFTFVTATGETQLGPLSAPVTVVDKTVNGQIVVSGIPIGGGFVTARKAYMVPVAGGAPRFAALVNDNVATTLTINVADSGLGAQAPLTNSTDDPELTTLIAAVRQRAELVTQRALITQTWDIYLDTWPSWQPEGIPTLLPGGGWVELPKPPLQSVTYVQYLDPSGVTQTWDPGNYVVDAPAGERPRKGRLALGWTKIWPILRYQMNAVTIRIVAGYGTTGAAVPALLRQGMLMDARSLYDVRASLLTGMRAAAIEIPRTSQDIFLSFRVR